VANLAADVSQDAYTLILALTTPGATADDRLDPGELLTLVMMPFSVAP
jgi:hypothetical protein